MGVVVVYDLQQREVADEARAVEKTVFPYIPGYLSFREGPAVLSAFRQTGIIPDVIIFDGQGMAHPRGAGIASHLGILLGIPSVGCAKTRLVGEYEEPGLLRGDRAELRYNGRVVGAVVRTRTGVKPLFVSPGHLVTLEDSVRIVMEAAFRYRLPEPVRLAHKRATELRKRYQPPV
jgi:deoxyribonuclease V